MSELSLNQSRSLGLTRQRWMEILIPITAASMVLQYVMQGVLVSGDGGSLLSDFFWYAEWGLWGMRAFVESGVIVYLFKTQAERVRDKFVLTFFEVSLIALIMFTLGPTLRALTTEQAISDMLTGTQLTLWSFGLAAYSAFMMAGVGVAYRIQPSDVETLTVAEHDYQLANERAQRELDKATDKQNLQAKVAQVEELESQLSELATQTPELDFLRAYKSTIASIDFSTAKGIGTLIGFVSQNGGRPKPGKVATALSVSVPAVSPALKEGARMREELGEL